MKNHLLIIIFATIAILTGCQEKPLTKEQAKHEALAKFQQFCMNFHVSSNDFFGPIDDGQGNGHFAFKWEDMSQENHLIVLVMVQKNGEVNLSTINQSRGLKYRHIAP